MTLVYLALLAIGSGPIGQSAQPVAVIQRSPDSAEQRQTLKAFVVCMAESRPKWARKTLADPYLSNAQATTAAQALSGSDNCVRNYREEITFRTSGVVGSLAEHFLAGKNNIDEQRLQAALETMEPLNASEDFALCVTSRAPMDARKLALSEPGSSTESESAQRIAQHVSPCTKQTEAMTVDVQSLRALVATALYRGTMVVLAKRD